VKFRKLIGYLLVALPFITLFIFVSVETSAVVAIKIFSVSALVMALIACGLWLTEDGSTQSPPKN